MIPGGPPKVKVKKKAKPKPKPKYTPPPSRSDAAQGTGAKPVKRRTSPNKKTTVRSAVGDTSRPADPVAVPRVRDGKVIRKANGKPSVRTFRNTDDYKAYRRRKHVKAVVRRQERQRVINNAKRDLAELTPKGERLAASIERDMKHDIREKGEALRSKYVKGGERPADYDERMQRELDRTAKRAKREAVSAGTQAGNKYNRKVVAAPASRERVKRRVRKRMRKQERVIDAIGTEMQRRHDTQISRGVAPEGTSSARGITVAARKRQQAAKAKALAEAHKKRRKGGVGQWLTNAKDELVDTAASAPAAAVAGGKIAVDTAKGIGENFTRAASITSGGGKPLVRRKKYGKKLPAAARATVKGYVDQGVLPALAQGNLKEALGRLKERPLSGVSEVLPVAGLGAKAVRGASVAGRVAKAKPKGVKATRQTVRQERSKQRVRMHTRPDLNIGANAKKQRSYSKVTGVRVVQKAKDKGLKAAGRDPHTKRHGIRVGPVKTGQQRLLAKDADVVTRNVQHGGQHREEREAYEPVRKAHKKAGVSLTAKRHRTKRTALELMVRNGELRTGTLTETKKILHEIRTTLAKPENRREHTDDSLKQLDTLIADMNENRHSSFVMTKATRDAAEELAQTSRASDHRQSLRQYAEEGRLDYVARLQGMIERGLVRPVDGSEGPGPKVAKEGGGSPTTPSPAPRVASGRDAPVGERTASVPTVPAAKVTHTAGRGKGMVTHKSMTEDPEIRVNLAAKRTAVTDAKRKAQLHRESQGVREHQALQNRVTELEGQIAETRAAIKKSDSGSDRARLSNRVQHLGRQLEYADKRLAKAEAHPHLEALTKAERELTIAEDALAKAPRPSANRALDVSDAFVPGSPGPKKAPKASTAAVARHRKAEAQLERERNEAQAVEQTRQRRAIPEPPNKGAVDAAVYGYNQKLAERFPDTVEFDSKTGDVRVRTEKEAREVAPVSADELVRDASQQRKPPKYVWESGPFKGKVVTGDHLEEMNPGGAFIRGSKLKTNEQNRVLAAPEAGTGYAMEDLLQKRGDRVLPSELEKQQRGTLIRMTRTVEDRYAHRDRNGNVERYVTEEGAKRKASTLPDYTAMKVSNQYVVVPKVIAKRVDSQLAPIGHVEALGRWGTRTAIRATLPFSIMWHAGNVVDLATRLALTTSPRSWATEGVAMAKALEHQMGELNADLRDELLATLKGHMGSRVTLKRPKASDSLYDAESGEYAFPRLAASSDALGNLVRKTGGPWMIDRAFDISSDIEHAFVKRAIGAHAKDYAQDLGIQVEETSKMMRELAEQLVDDPNKIHALQARVLETVGDFTTRSPAERKIMRGVDPFWKWLKASTKFVMLTLPSKHPIKTALMLNMAKLTADERTKAGLNQYWSDDEYDDLRSMIGAPARGEAFTMGALGNDTGITPTGGFTSFGEVAKNISDPAALAGRPLSFVTRAGTAAAGFYRTPGEIGVKALPGGGQVSDLKLPKSIDEKKRAAQLGSEVALPGLKQLRRVLEGGTRPDLDSTAWSPSSAPVGADYKRKGLQQGLDAVLNPTHKQLPYSSDVKSTKQAIAAAPGQMFKVRHENVDGSFTVYWVRRAP